MSRAALVAVALSLATLAGCGSSAASAGPGTPASPDASVDAASAPDGAVDGGSADSAIVDAAADVDKSATCAKTFGTALTNAFGRLDGTVLAVVPPNDQACAAPNATHLVIQVQMGGATYRMVTDVLSNQGSPDVLLYELDAPLASGAWAEGWHPGAQLDYVATLGVHSDPFVAMHEADLVAKITSEIDLGAKISVFATSAGEADSAHLVHRNAANADGAIVIRPDSANPHYLLLRFGEQVF